MKISKEVKIGIMALVSGVVLYLGFNFLKGTDFFSPIKTYYVFYNDIDGLTVSNPVVINGFSVGRVNDIVLDQEHNNRIKVELQIDKEIVLGDSTQAFLSSVDLLGGKSIVLKLGRNSRIYESGDTLAGSKEKGFIQVLGDKATPVISNLDSTILKINAILGDETNSNVKKLLNNLVVASESLKQLMAENKQNIKGITGNLNTLSASLVETEKSLKPILAKFNTLADSLNDLELKRVVNNANTAMANLSVITEKINKGDGSLGALINDKKTVENLNRTMSSIDALVIDLQKHPKNYLSPLGRSAKKIRKDLERDSLQGK
ncbi:MAG TPA: MlaD family protein [Cytophagaceae bacterium]|nr:MlaD family protein [Cytophagaceae bacterium]